MPKKKPAANPRPSLPALLRFWGPLLAPGWAIVVRYERHLQGARVEREGRYRMATVVIGEPSDHQDADHAKDVELELVHELCHLPMAPFEHEPDSPRGYIEDQAVETYARALVALRRAS